jgi:hypothetical protein
MTSTRSPEWTRSRASSAASTTSSESKGSLDQSGEVAVSPPASPMVEPRFWPFGRTIILSFQGDTLFSLNMGLWYSCFERTRSSQSPSRKP